MCLLVKPSVVGSMIDPYGYEPKCFHFGMDSDVDIGSFSSDIFSSNIRITDVDVGCQISPTLRSMSMPTYGGMELLDLVGQDNVPDHTWESKLSRAIDPNTGTMLK
jgi:hypothetical protein